jgi:hypothetical protein
VPELLVRIKKKNDGSAALACQRADGSVTWQRQDGQLGRFFPLHDLTHFAVESVLGFDRAFFGLIARGWDISRFGERGIGRTLPEQAMIAELLAGSFDLERATGVSSTADEVNGKIALYFAEHEMPPTSFVVTDDQLERIRQARGDLFTRWRGLPAGESLEIVFQ